MSGPTQVVVLLDVHGPAEVGDVLAHVPDRRDDRHVLRLTDFGLERAPNAPRDQLDWPRISSSVAALAHQVRTICSETAAVDIYVAGLAPLTAFFALGVELDARTASITMLQNRRSEPGRYDPLALSVDSTNDDVLVAAGVDTSMPSEGTGLVAAFLSVQHHDAPRDLVRESVVSMGADLLGITRLAVPTGGPARVQVSSENVAGLANQVQRFFADLAAAYPHRSGLSLYIAGPTSLALLAGLSLNPNQHLSRQAAIHVHEFVADHYFHALSLPHSPVSSTVPPADEASIARRKEAFQRIRAGVERLQRGLQTEHILVPWGIGTSDEDRERIGAGVLQRLRDLHLPDEATADAFDIDVVSGTLRVGDALLQPMSRLPAETLERLGQLFVLHEILHEHQGIGSHNYQGVGRSGVVLEDIDFWADAFAIATTARWRLSEDDRDTARAPADVVSDLIGAHLEGLQAFDAMEHTPGPDWTIAERRLRRYLIWYIQQERTRAIRTEDDLHELFRSRLFAQLAPLRCRLDERCDRLVVSPLPTTTLCVGTAGGLERIAALPQNFSPAELVDAIRSMDADAARAQVRYVVAEHRDLLTPWAAT